MQSKYSKRFASRPQIGTGRGADGQLVIQRLPRPLMQVRSAKDVEVNLQSALTGGR